VCCSVLQCVAQDSPASALSPSPASASAASPSSASASASAHDQKSHCVAVCCSGNISACCNVLQCVTALLGICISCIAFFCVCIGICSRPKCDSMLQKKNVGVLQCVAVEICMCVAVSCSPLRRLRRHLLTTKKSCSVLPKHISVYCSVLQRKYVSVLQCVAVCCRPLGRLRRHLLTTNVSVC